MVEAEAERGPPRSPSGGIHPSFDGDYYLHVAEAVHEAVPGMHIHGYRPGGPRGRPPARRAAPRLPAAAQGGRAGQLPGTAAEILDDEVRAVICPDKVTTDEWLEVHRVAHSVELLNITIMFGHVESPRHWARHLLRTRAMQAETGGVHRVRAAAVRPHGRAHVRERQSRPGPTFREAVLIHAVGGSPTAG